jgi:hypothetical protein
VNISDCARLHEIARDCARLHEILPDCTRLCQIAGSYGAPLEARFMRDQTSAERGPFGSAGRARCWLSTVSSLDRPSVRPLNTRTVPRHRHRDWPRLPGKTCAEAPLIPADSRCMPLCASPERQWLGGGQGGGSGRLRFAVSSMNAGSHSFGALGAPGRPNGTSAAGQLGSGYCCQLRAVDEMVQLLTQRDDELLPVKREAGT